MGHSGLCFYRQHAHMEPAPLETQIKDTQESSIEAWDVDCHVDKVFEV